METDKIEIKVDVTFGDFFRAISERTFKTRPVFILLAVCFIAPVTLFSAFLALTGDAFPAITAVVILVMIVLYIFGGIYRSAKRAAAKSKENTVWTFSRSGYKIVSELGRAEIKWEALDGIIESKEYFLLVVQRPVFHVIPKRFFQDSEAEKFRELAVSALGERARMRR